MNIKFAVFADNEFKFIWVKDFQLGNSFEEVIGLGMYMSSVPGNRWFKSYMRGSSVEADEVPIEFVPNVYKALKLLL